MCICDSNYALHSVKLWKLGLFHFRLQVWSRILGHFPMQRNLTVYIVKEHFDGKLEHRSPPDLLVILCRIFFAGAGKRKHSEIWHTVMQMNLQSEPVVLPSAKLTVALEVISQSEAMLHPDFKKSKDGGKITSLPPAACDPLASLSPPPSQWHS